MRVGVHLPQYGRVAGPEAMARAARHAEELGFVDVWVSDHIVHPAAQSYPSPYLLDPLVALTWAAAVTDRIGLGTSVLVVPMHNPLELANALASLDVLSVGRLTVAVGVGWSEAEYAALGYDFHNRGARLDEAVDLFRRAWSEDPLTFHGRFTSVDDLRILPQPGRTIPIWIGGAASPPTGGRRPGATATRRWACPSRRWARSSSASDATIPTTLPHLAAHRLGSPGHGTRPDPGRAGRVHRGRHPARGGRAVAA